ncbi:MAG: alpha-D-ribose 1-methylphosphonate 5-phosphate C-P-lyase PhnJ [Deltaproteobacteria bacterium]|jgi:alpha-D-ribose 1-methylphosphonate 5-phosphate C-P lyase|nr:alpha-D-ribose 1-methylphosphonate 5-phosphate C-P-lyase PhnJ [Deltaproteobacteria bacterium]
MRGQDSADGGSGMERGGSIREILGRGGLDGTEGSGGSGGYNFAYLDEDTKREIRRALLKAVAVPGYQVPFSGREMPMPYGWGTGGIQVTASVIGPGDVLKVIDQGSDDTTNAVSIRNFHRALTGVATTSETRRATLIQTRHRIPEAPLREGQIMVYQVPLPEPMRQLEPSELETRTLHALNEYGTMYLKLYEDVARHGEIAISYDYPVMVAGRHAASPSPIPRFDNPKLDRSPALHLFGAGRERRVYAIPPYTIVKSFDFSDHPFRIQSWDRACEICGSADSYLDEIVTDDRGGRMFVCSDSDHCQERVKRAGTGESGSVGPTATGNAGSTPSGSVGPAPSGSVGRGGKP